jgi:hypothetical protein
MNDEQTRNSSSGSLTKVEKLDEGELLCLLSRTDGIENEKHKNPKTHTIRQDQSMDAL